VADLRLPVIDKSKCTLCGMCVDICPEQVLAVDAGELVFANPENCTMCAQCESVCPEGAVNVYYRIGWADK